MKPELIKSSEKMDELLNRLNTVNLIAVDTEFFRETTYYPQLALVQVATDSVVVCIDPLAFDAKPGLKKLLLDSNITKIFHSCSQDLEVLFYYLGEAPNVIYDTQIANALLTEHHQIGYAALVENELGVALDKSQTRTNWLQRPLTQKQLQYAGDDVLYLYQLHKILNKKLQQLDRKIWFDEESKNLIDDNNLFQVTTDTLWTRIKGTSKLNRNKLAIAQAIAEWREQLAQQKDKTRRRLLADDIVVDLAFSAPENTEEVENIIGKKYNFTQQEKQKLVDAINIAKKTPTEQCPNNRFNMLDNEQKSLLKTLQQLTNNKAEKLGISNTILSSKKTLETLVLSRGQTNLSCNSKLSVMQGWRLQCIGQELLEKLKKL
ncbi:Ribonuclease D [hydrothermal vent metagenome]|uniref:Ribonuclease D n=1 Tax=hydrothermal vent metagenome TaxID=652676 RepID=A0A3B0WIT8_9ZZZZ